MSNPSILRASFPGPVKGILVETLALHAEFVVRAQHHRAEDSGHELLIINPASSLEKQVRDAGGALEVVTREDTLGKITLD